MGKNRIHEDTKIIRKSGILSSKVNDEVIILNVSKGEYNGFDKVGSDIWNELENPIRIDDLVFNLMGKYNVSKQECRSDVISFVTELIEIGLVEVEHGNH